MAVAAVVGVGVFVRVNVVVGAVGVLVVVAGADGVDAFVGVVDGVRPGEEVEVAVAIVVSAAAPT